MCLGINLASCKTHAALANFPIALAGQLRDQELSLLHSFPELDAGEYMRACRIRVPVIEFRDAALADQPAEFEKAARPLRDRHRQQGLAPLTEFRPL